MPQQPAYGGQAAQPAPNYGGLPQPGGYGQMGGYDAYGGAGAGGAAPRGGRERFHPYGR